MKIIKGSSKGFFAICHDTARHISQSINDNEEFFVEWGNETLYYDSNYGNNAWEYFFEQKYNRNNITKTVSDYTDLFPLKGSFRETMNFLYSNFFILNKKIKNLLAPHINILKENKTLGVHIRRTDKFKLGMYGTTTKSAPVDLELFRKEIDNIVNNYDYIFLATDCSVACKYIKDIYGKKVLYNREAIRSSNTNSVHHDLKGISGYKKGLDVLTDAVLLSNCKHLIRSSSNVSIAPLYINLNLTQTNLNVKYAGDSEAEIL